jgi:hypothetical protein
MNWAICGVPDERFLLQQDSADSVDFRWRKASADAEYQHNFGALDVTCRSGSPGLVRYEYALLIAG